MALLQVPTSSDPFYTQVSNLDGTDFVLKFRFNQRENSWYVSIYLPSGELLLAGIKIVCNWPLLSDFKADVRLPPGELIAISQTDDSNPGLDELGIGKRVTLYYNSVT